MQNKLLCLRHLVLLPLSVTLLLTAVSVLAVQASRWGPEPHFVATRPDSALRASAPGTITGIIYYSGTVTGTHMAWAGTFTPEGGPPIHSVMRSGPGAYTLTDVTEGVYNIMAGMDADDSGGAPDPAKDPLGLYAHNPVTVTSGAVLSGVDIVLLDPGAPPTSTASMRGRVTYTGRITPTHQIIVVASLWQTEGPPAYSAVIPAPGAYEISGMAAASYAVGAFMDLGDDMGPPEPNEPFRWYDHNGDGNPDPVAIGGGDPVIGIDIALVDRLRYIYLYLPLIRRQ